MGIDVHLIPTNSGFEHEDLYLEMIRLGVHIHAPNDWTVLQEGDAVIGFCNGEFLENMLAIRQRTKRTLFVNCMTWLFNKEKELMKQGIIAMFLYQNEEVRQKNMPLLKCCNDGPSIAFMTFKPYFHNEFFPFIEERAQEYFGCGRISRQDADKFAVNTFHIYEYSVASVFNRGGWRKMVEHGKPGWLCDHERDFIYYASKMAYESNLIEEKNMKKKTNIVVGICSCHGMGDKRKAVRSTWLAHSAKGIECVFFVGGNRTPEGEEEDTVGLDAVDGYDELPGKVKSFFRYALENYEFDWLFKCDDDTYLELSRSTYPYEKNGMFRARVLPSEGEYYVTGGFNGGRAKDYLCMCRELADAVRQDLDNGVVAVWHDESHLNKYVIGRHPLVLSPEYLFPETLSFNQKNLTEVKPKVKMIVKDKSLQKNGGYAWMRQQI